MKKYFTVIFLLLITSCLLPQNKGHLVIIGGGAIPDYVISKFVELAGGIEAKILIVPMASSEPELAANSFIKKLKNAGCYKTEVLNCGRDSVDLNTNVSKLRDVKGVFFTGGDQSKLTAALEGTKFLEGIKTIYSEGGVVGGTSAGAAVMSRIMITGKELTNTDSVNSYNTITKGNIETAVGFGFYENSVVDQHFIKRKRLTRLISVILENPKLTGIGIDESTAVITNNDFSFSVLGESLVTVIEADQCTDISVDKNNHQAAKDIKLHLLKSGDIFRPASLKGAERLNTK